MYREFSYAIRAANWPAWAISLVDSIAYALKADFAMLRTDLVVLVIILVITVVLSALFAKSFSAKPLSKFQSDLAYISGQEFYYMTGYYVPPRDAFLITVLWHMLILAYNIFGLVTVLISCLILRIWRLLYLHEPDQEV